jgi:hypothetical protein
MGYISEYTFKLRNRLTTSRLTRYILFLKYIIILLILIIGYKGGDSSLTLALRVRLNIVLTPTLSRDYKSNLGLRLTSILRGYLLIIRLTNYYFQ